MRSPATSGNSTILAREGVRRFVVLPLHADATDGSIFCGAANAIATLLHNGTL